MDWLLDLPHRLDVAIDVVGPDFVPAVAVASTPAAVTLRRALATHQSLRTALETVMRSRGSQPALVDGLQTMCFGLTTSGALVVARHVPDGGSTDESLRDLGAIGAWLLEPIETALTKPDVISVEPYRIASLRRILDEAAARGSARTVLGAFVEALGVWDELHGFGYAAAVDGTFVRYASPRGVPGEGIPVVMDGAAVPRADHVMRLSPEDRDRLHIGAGADEVLVRRMKGADELEWLLVFRGSVDEPERVRLTLYADILREALDKTLGTTCHRLVESIHQRPPLPPDEPVDATAQAFVGKLMSSVDARQAAFVMVTTTGRQVFSVGKTDLLNAVEDEQLATQLVVTASDADSLLTFVAMRSEPAFTTFERHIARIGVAAVQRWFQAHLRHSKEYERRERFRGVDTLFEELARDAVRSGQHVSMAVVSLGPNVLRPGVLRAGVVKLRDHIRSCDFAGMLSATEIAVLAPDVPPAQAELLSARLRHILASGEPDAGSGYPLVGVTTWSPESETPGSIVASARAALRAAV